MDREAQAETGGCQPRGPVHGSSHVLLLDSPHVIGFLSSD